MDTCFFTSEDNEGGRVMFDTLLESQKLMSRVDDWYTVRRL